MNDERTPPAKVEAEHRYYLLYGRNNEAVYYKWFTTEAKMNEFAEDVSELCHYQVKYRLEEIT